MATHRTYIVTHATVYYDTSAQDDNTGKLRIVLHEIFGVLPDIVLHKLCQRSHISICVYTFCVYALFLKF